MKILSKVSVRNTLSMFLAVSMAFGLANRAVAADKDTQSLEDCAKQKLTTVPNNASDETSRWERWQHNLNTDGVEAVEAQVYYGNTCFTPWGSCAIFNGPLPVGTPCWCPSGAIGRVGLP
jgi:hypothetical protein